MSGKVKRVKACPFCGGEAGLRSDFSDEALKLENCCTAFVSCLECLAESQVADSCAATFNTEQDAIDAWNRRPTANPAEEGELEALADRTEKVLCSLAADSAHNKSVILTALKRVSGSGATQERVKIKGRCKHGEIPGFCPKCKEMVGSGATQTEKTYAGYPDFSTVPTQSIIDSNREIHELRKRLYSKNSELQAPVTGEEREAAVDLARKLSSYVDHHKTCPRYETGLSDAPPCDCGLEPLIRSISTFTTPSPPADSGGGKEQ